MNEPIWRESALLDLDRIVSYVFSRNPVAAAALDQAIRSRARKAAQFPHAARRGRTAGTREAVVARTYILVYRLSEHGADPTVEIISVVHCRQDYPRRIAN